MNVNMRDIDNILEIIKTRHPNLLVEQLEKINVGDDDGIWFIGDNIQIESWNGQCPFLIESTFDEKQLNCSNIHDAVEKIESMIAFCNKDKYA